MKMKTWLFSLFVTMLVVCFSLPAHAYKISVKNEMDKGCVYVKVVTAEIMAGGGQYLLFSGYCLPPGREESVSNDDWQNKGVCWDSLYTSLIDCDSYNSWVYHPLARCQDTRITLKRDGCKTIVHIE